MPTELIQIPTDDHPLDGLYYTPDGPIRNAAVYFHGNQMNFYLGAARFLAPMLTDLGYAFLAFNRRGHDTVSGYDSRDAVGGAFQTTPEGIEDCELATRFLARSQRVVDDRVDDVLPELVDDVWHAAVPQVGHVLFERQPNHTDARPFDRAVLFTK